MKRSLLLLCVFTLLTGVTAAQAATTHFSDNFDSENGGVGVLNYGTVTGSFANWTVSDGSVDLIGSPGFHNFFPGNGLYVDMDGSTGNAGILTSTDIVLDPGTYTLSFELAGNGRNPQQDQVDVAVTVGHFTSSYGLSYDTPFQLFTETFTLDSAQTVNLVFEGLGRDNVGMLLDDVSLTSTVPAPGAILLGSIGASFVGWFRKRRAL